MAAFFSSPREARTTLPCPQCAEAMDIRRSCREAYMQCSACSQQFPVARFIPAMDAAMEHFLEQLFVDRV